MSQKTLKQRILGFFADNDVKVKVRDEHSSEYLEAERVLINAESQYGRTLFGEIAPGATREFFCLKKNVWIWYEQGSMIRYEVRKDAVYKKVDNGPYVKISGIELQNFRTAVKTYSKLVREEFYNK